MSNQQQSQTDFPDGYVTIESDNGQRYLVPHFMIPATHQAMEAYRKKLEFNVHKTDGGVSSFFLHFNRSWADVGRCLGPTSWADVSGQGRVWLPTLSILIHYRFPVWKHDRCTILCYGPKPAYATG